MPADDEAREIARGLSLIQADHLLNPINEWRTVTALYFTRPDMSVGHLIQNSAVTPLGLRVRAALEAMEGNDAPT